MSTIDEFQGKQTEHIGVIRTSNKMEHIYYSQSNCLVHNSKQTKYFVYLTLDTNDRLSKWVQDLPLLN